MDPCLIMLTKRKFGLYLIPKVKEALSGNGLGLLKSKIKILIFNCSKIAK